MGLSFAAPLVGRDMHWWTFIGYYMISIHAPLAGCDRTGRPRPAHISHFNPRTPCGVRRVRDLLLRLRQIDFNPRTPCGVRPQGAHFSFQRQDFNPRTPCGVRLIHEVDGLLRDKFQSTHPLRGATKNFCSSRHRKNISIHAPLAGCDSKSAQKNAALLRKRYKYKFFVCKKCTSGDLTGAYSSKNTLYSGANCSENPCALSVRTHRISGPSTSNPGLMPKCSILERYFSPR